MPEPAMEKRCAALVLILDVACGPTPVLALGPRDFTLGPLRIDDPWARPTPGHACHHETDDHEEIEPHENLSTFRRRRVSE
jgi:hypothetical protein